MKFKTRTTRFTTARLTFTTTVAALTLTTLLAACGGSGGTNLTADETDACSSIAQLDEGDSDDRWNERFSELANVENDELREVGQAYAAAFLTSVEQATPYRDRALRICEAAGWTAPETETGQGD